MKARKPYIQATLENTTNDNAVASREMLEKIYAVFCDLYGNRPSYGDRIQQHKDRFVL